MKNWMLLAAAGMMAGPVPVEALTVPSTISASGEGNWEIICHIVKPGGDQLPIILSPQRSTYADREMRHASCEIRNANKGPLTVTIAAPAMDCPFKSATGDVCEQTLAKGRAGSFELSLKKAK